MKKTLFISAIALLTLGSCHKKYEEKSGTFTGIESYVRVPYDNENDTLDFDFEVATYTLSYDKKNKSYSVSGSSGNFTSVTFDREDFEDNQAEGGNAISFSGWQVELNGNSLTAAREEFDFNELEAWTFEGDKN